MCPHSAHLRRWNHHPPKAKHSTQPVPLGLAAGLIPSLLDFMGSSLISPCVSSTLANWFIRLRQPTLFQPPNVSSEKRRTSPRVSRPRIARSNRNTPVPMPADDAGFPVPATPAAAQPPDLLSAEGNALAPGQGRTVRPG